MALRTTIKRNTQFNFMQYSDAECFGAYADPERLHESLGLNKYQGISYLKILLSIWFLALLSQYIYQLT